MFLWSFFCPADHVLDWQPRVLLGMVEARSVNVKKTTTTSEYSRLGQGRDGNSTTGSLTKRHTGPLHASVPSIQSVTLSPHLSRMNYYNKLSSIVYPVATSLSPVPRICLRRRLSERPLGLPYPDWDFIESLMAEA